MTEQPWYLKDYKKAMKAKGRVIPMAEAQIMRMQMERNSHRDTEHLHPSELSKKDWCGRAAVYKITGVPAAPDSMSFSRLNVFEEGHAIHEKWQTWLWKAGVLHGAWSCKKCSVVWVATSPDSCVSCGSPSIRYNEVPIQNDEHRILGHADGEIQDSQGKALIEIKSVGVGTVRFEKPSLHADYQKGQITIDEVWKNIKTPFASHLRQGNLYMYCTGVHEMVFIYEWKPTQEVKEFSVKYNEEIVAPLLENCKAVIAHLEANTIPDRPDWAVDSKCKGCTYCPYKKVCW